MSAIIPSLSTLGLSNLSPSLLNTGSQHASNIDADQSLSVDLHVQLRALLHVANMGLGLSVLGVLISVMVCYPLESQFSMPELIAGHLSLILSATLVKICYVGRCIAQYGLQQEVR